VVVVPEVATSASLAPVVMVATGQMPVGGSEDVGETRAESAAFKIGVSSETSPLDVATATIPDVPPLVAVAPSSTHVLRPNSKPFVPIIVASPKAPTGVSGDLTEMVVAVAPAEQPRRKYQSEAGSLEHSASQFSGESSGRFGAPKGSLEQGRVIIHANSDSWVQVRAADSTTIITRVMRAGDSYRVPARDGLRLFTGNVGALTIEVDGEMLPKIGGLGQIARNVDLEPENLKLRVN
jgi:cytoskeleton protein RodZ